MKTIRKILYPFSLLYGAITSTRNHLYNAQILTSTKFKTPTIVVGNLSVGGTGKTPQIEYLIRLLKSNFEIAVLSRGYKRKTKGFLLADEKVNAQLIGDEPYQYFTKFKNIKVAVDADRVNGIQQLIQLNNKLDVVLLDDAFQHRKVEAGFNILLTSYNDLYVDDKMLPTGNLREKVSGAERAKAIIVTKCPSDLTEEKQFEVAKRLNPTLYQTVFFTTIEYDDVIKGSSKIKVDDLNNYEVLLITGIANPKPLTNFLKEKKVVFNHMKFADHYFFTEGDAAEIELKFSKIKSKNKIILTTEKDYVRIFEKFEKLHYLPIKTEFINHKKDFDNLILEYVGTSSRNS
ncbi:tetraacyldisaccharide 4'-kinase [Lutibacter sp. TH_r2]|uniref:tetraacyldisaccharide 4'-kinase n=1 Tax=Lutibacter sp. TH_r2 TaxID=3082083 RepID=UPI0029559B85|nr:tetraacyldisaccharide 4'-kinase [Lutibacter sp. TH_r2]MDV7187106.1 tetraacyldisaccharide 4'-kinase [Lutibacter sp. TH_r2]